MYRLANINLFENIANKAASEEMLVFNSDAQDPEDWFKPIDLGFIKDSPMPNIEGNVRIRYGKPSTGWGVPAIKISKNIPLKDLSSTLDDIKDEDANTVDIAYGDEKTGDRWGYERNNNDPSDTITRWRERLMEDPKFKRLLYTSSMSDKVREAYEQLPEEDRTLPDESDTYDSWVDKMGANPLFKKAEIINKLPKNEAAIYDLSKSFMPEIADDDTYDTWHEKLENNNVFRKLRFLSQLPQEEMHKALIRSLPEADVSDTAETWLKKLS